MKKNSPNKHDELPNSTLPDNNVCALMMELPRTIIEMDKHAHDIDDVVNNTNAGGGVGTLTICLMKGLN